MTLYPLDSQGLAVVPDADLNTLPAGLEVASPEALASHLAAGITGASPEVLAKVRADSEAACLPSRSGNIVKQTVKANGRYAVRTLNLVTGDNWLHWLD